VLTQSARSAANRLDDSGPAAGAVTTDCPKPQARAAPLPIAARRGRINQSRARVSAPRPHLYRSGLQVFPGRARQASLARTCLGLSLRKSGALVAGRPAPQWARTTHVSAGHTEQ